MWGVIYHANQKKNRVDQEHKKAVDLSINGFPYIKVKLNHTV